MASFAAVTSLLSRTQAESLIPSPPAACRSLEKRGAQLGSLGLRKKKVFLLLFIIFYLVFQALLHWRWLHPRENCWKRDQAGQGRDRVLGVFPSRIVTVLSPGRRAALSPCPGATVSHVHRTSRIWDSSRRTARTAPGKGEAKSLSGKILCYLKLSKTPLTKCYFGTNTCCQLTPGTATTAAPSATATPDRGSSLARV